MLDWDDLKLFLAVAREGSTLAAARGLGLNQTTVSRRMQALEQGLGLTLFHRRTTGYGLTEHGKAIRAAAEGVEAAAAATEAEAGRLRRELTGLVRITAPEVFFRLILAPIVAEFRAIHPEVQVEQISSEAPLDLEAGEADIAFRATRGPIPETLIARKLADLGWSAYCSRGYAARHGCPQTPEALRGHAVVMFEQAAAQAARARLFAGLVDPARIVARCNTVSNMRSIVGTGMGVGFLPCMEGDAEPTLLRCFNPLPELEDTLWLVMPRALQRVPRIRQFADFAARRFRPHRAQLRGDRA